MKSASRGCPDGEAPGQGRKRRQNRAGDASVPFSVARTWSRAFSSDAPAGIWVIDPPFVIGVHAVHVEPLSVEARALTENEVDAGTVADHFRTPLE